MDDRKLKSYTHDICIIFTSISEAIFFFETNLPAKTSFTTGAEITVPFGKSHDKVWLGEDFLLV